MERAEVEELVYQALETEIGGVQVYTQALECVQNEELEEEWGKYLEQTKHHVDVMRSVCAGLGLDPETDTPGRKIVRFKGESLVSAMRMAIKAGKPDAAELVACECVVDAETKDHQNWELMRMASQKLSGEERAVLSRACEEVEDEEDEHLYHTMGWCRELWVKAIGLPAQLPPPEEKKEVKTAIGAARAKQSRTPSRAG
jgi:rubrerythrin